MRKLLLLIILFCASCITPRRIELLDGSRSYDLDGEIVKYEWRLIIGSKAKIFKPLAMITFVEITKGTHSFELEVTDDRGATDRDTITIR